jgi:hypothetical protein
MEELLLAMAKFEGLKRIYGDLIQEGHIARENYDWHALAMCNLKLDNLKKEVDTLEATVDNLIKQVTLDSHSQQVKSCCEHGGSTCASSHEYRQCLLLW